MTRRNSKQMRVLRGLLAGLFVFPMLIVLMWSAGAVGAAASWGSADSATIEIDDGAHGESYLKTVRLLYKGDNPVDVELAKSGDISEWVSFREPGNVENEVEKLVAVPGEWLNVPVVITVPEDAPVGESTGTLYFTAIVGKYEGGEGESGVGLRFQATKKVKINVVGTPIVSGSVRNFRAEDTEVGFPVRIAFDFDNTGNVRAYPRIEVTILQDGETVDTFVRDGIRLERGVTPVSVEWDTKFADPGEYVANVDVYLEDQLVGSGEAGFAVLREGALTRAGAITGIELEDAHPTVGTLAKLLVSFRNVGEIDTKARFEAEVYLDGELVEYLQSGEVVIAAGKEGVIPAYFKIEQPGSYRFTGHVNYEGQVTSTMEISFDVSAAESEEESAEETPGGEPPATEAPENNDTSSSVGDGGEDEGGSSSFPLLSALIAVLVVLVVIGVGFLWRKKVRATG